LELIIVKLQENVYKIWIKKREIIYAEMKGVLIVENYLLVNK